jgi:hypothetical protein
MARKTTSLVVLAALASLVPSGPVAGQLTPQDVACQKAIVARLATFKKAYLKSVSKCLNFENEGKITGPCPEALTPDLVTLAKIQKAVTSAENGIPSKCTSSNLSNLGFRADCQYEAAATGVEGGCAALPVTDGKSFADCLLCWKRGELAELIAILYASHANEVCRSDLTETSPACSDLDCATPLPDQLNLPGTTTGGEEFCQKAIGKAGVKYTLYREKQLEVCALKGGTSASCKADATILLKLGNALAKMQTAITTACGNNRQPSPNEPFCCQLTTGQNATCSMPATRTDCTNAGGSVVEQKTCSGNGHCTGGGNKVITWWGVCPESDCTGTVTSLSDLIGCLGNNGGTGSADQVIDELLCLQFRHLTGGNPDWPCPTDLP